MTEIRQVSSSEQLKESLEIIRRAFHTVAQDMGLTEQRINEGCYEYENDTKGFSEAEKIALRFADLMYLDANQIDKAFYDEMKKHWSEAQIMELGSFMVCHYGMAMFMRSMGAKAAV